MATASRITQWQRAVIVLAGAVVFAVVVATLYFAQAVFIPVATAIFLTFLLSPPMMALQRRGLGRIPAMLAVVAATGIVLVGLGFLVGYQLENLAATLPQHSDNIQKKVSQVRNWMRGGILDQLKQLKEEVTKDLAESPKDAAKKGIDEPTPQPEAAPPAPAATAPVQSVVVQPPGSSFGLSALPTSVSGILNVAGGVALAGVLVVFMLLKREDMRNRLIRLIGHGRITTTTKAVDDGAHRVSRFLIMQLIVNGTYGLALTAGLFILSFFDMGVPYALLWGFLAAVMRYVPYVGAPLAALLPITLSLAVNPGWGAPLAIIGLVLVLELVSNNIMEPWLYGQSIGVSEVALLIAAAFWTLLWGPIGLVLSAPLTVCLVVLGKYVPQLNFVGVLLGDQPALEPHLVFYQRLLARDQDEAVDVVEEFVAAQPAEQVYDALLIPALCFAKRDRQAKDLTDDDQREVLAAAEEIAEDLAEASAVELEKTADEQPGRRAKLLGCPARDATDQHALQMLSGLLGARKWDVEVAPFNALASELIDAIEKSQPDALCIASLPPGGLAHTRYLIKRLRQRFPQMRIVVGRWGAKGDPEPRRATLTQAGADAVTTTLLETRAQLTEWLPVFLAETLDPTAPPEGRAKKLART